MIVGYCLTLIFYVRRQSNRPDVSRGLGGKAGGICGADHRLGQPAGRVVGGAAHCRPNIALRDIGAPNYSEARSAESRADFIHKLRIAVKELNETSIWLRVLGRSGLMKQALLEGLLAECDALRRILGASLRTARARSTKQETSIKR
ncbi:MAG: four helix bundle protein [Verrucomicrobiota bacterium]